MDRAAIDHVRRFNRTVTAHIGALDADYLGRGRPLAESRLLYEIGRDGIDVRELRMRLAVDSGYLSRLLRALETQGFVAMQASREDARVRRATLTRQGRREFDELDRRSDAAASRLLETLAPSQRDRLVTAMADVERLLRAAAVTIDVADPRDASSRACIDAYLAELAARFEGGFDPARSVSADPDELVPPAGVFLVASLTGVAVGCGGLKVLAPGVGELKRMWVAPSARGLGIARRMIAALEEQAVAMGLDTLRLDTNRRLVEARALYLDAGYVEIPAYNDNRYADHWFEKRLAGPVRRRRSRRL